MCDEDQKLEDLDSHFRVCRGLIKVAESMSKKVIISKDQIIEEEVDQYLKENQSFINSSQDFKSTALNDGDRKLKKFVTNDSENYPI